MECATRQDMPGRLAPQHIQPDAREPAHAQYAGCSPGQIDDAPGDERSAVVDHDLDRASAAHVRDAHARTEGKRPVRGGHGIGVEPSARGDALWLRVVGGDAERAGMPPPCRAEAAPGPGRRSAAVMGRARSVMRGDAPSDVASVRGPLVAPHLPGTAAMMPALAVVRAGVTTRPGRLLIVGIADGRAGQTQVLWVHRPSRR